MGHADTMCISYVSGDARVMSVSYWFRTRYSEYRIRISLRCIDSNGVEGASYMFIEIPIVVVINMLLVLLDAVSYYCKGKSSTRLGIHWGILWDRSYTELPFSSYQNVQHCLNTSYRRSSSKYSRFRVGRKVSSTNPLKCKFSGRSINNSS